MEDDVVLAADLAGVRNRLHHTYLVVSKHDSDQDVLVVDGPLQVFEVDQAIRLNRQVGDAVAVLFQALTGIEHRFVLGYLGNDVVAALTIHLGYALDGQVVALGRARGKDDFLGGGANQLGYLLTSLLYGLLGFPSKGVVAAGCITELGGEEGNHRIKHTRIHRRGGVVIHVDWQLYVCGGRHCSLNGAHCALSPAFNIVVLNFANSIIRTQLPKLTSMDSTGLPWYFRPGSCPHRSDTRIAFNTSEMLSFTLRSGSRMVQLSVRSQPRGPVAQEVINSGPSIAPITSKAVMSSGERESAYPPLVPA